MNFMMESIDLLYKYGCFKLKFNKNDADWEVMFYVDKTGELSVKVKVGNIENYVIKKDEIVTFIGVIVCSELFLDMRMQWNPVSIENSANDSENSDLSRNLKAANVLYSFFLKMMPLDSERILELVRTKDIVSQIRQVKNDQQCDASKMIAYEDIVKGIIIRKNGFNCLLELAYDIDIRNIDANDWYEHKSTFFSCGDTSNKQMVAAIKEKIRIFNNKDIRWGLNDEGTELAINKVVMRVKMLNPYSDEEKTFSTSLYIIEQAFMCADLWSRNVTQEDVDEAIRRFQTEMERQKNKGAFTRQDYSNGSVMTPDDVFTL